MTTPQNPSVETHIAIRHGIMSQGEAGEISIGDSNLVTICNYDDLFLRPIRELDEN